MWIAADPLPEDLVAVGKIGPARGVRGEVFVEPWTDAPDERFAAGTVLHTGGAPLTVESSSRGGGKQVVHFAGVADRAGAEALRGIVLFVPAAQRPSLDDPDEFYDTDLVGLAARSTAGVELGTVSDVQHAGGASYLVVDGHLIPFVRAIVPTVDLAGGFVLVDPPDGLFDL